MNNTNTSDKLSPAQLKNFSLEKSVNQTLSLLPPIFTDLYQNNEKNQVLLNPILEALNEAINQFEFDVGRGKCPNCGDSLDLSLFKKKNINQRQILTKGNNKINVKVINYYCSICKYQNKEHHNLTLTKGKYDRHIVLSGVRFYTCGMSYRLVQANLYAQFQVLPSLSTILYWVQAIGIVAHKLNQDALKELKGIDITWDEFFLAIRNGQTDEEHTPVFSTLFMELHEGAFLYGGMNIGKQTNLLIVKSHLKQVKHHEPRNGVADGCRSYPGACAEVLPEMRFISDPVHKARSVRKKKTIKNFIKEKKNWFKEQFQKQWKKEISNDRKDFQKELTRLARQHPSNFDAKREIQNAKKDWNAMEQKEIEALEELTEQETQYFEYRVQRSIYVGQEAAQLARSKHDDKPPLQKPLTSCKIEGWNRYHRSRERRMLCYRSLVSFYAMIGLLGLLHNMVGVGRGCIYTRLGLEKPYSPWNPFLNFPPAKKTEKELGNEESTPFRQRKTKYRQQHGKLFEPPESYQSQTFNDLEQLKSIEVSSM